jgi:glycosyltransferase involved in cell wall biosynthesis
LLEGYFIGKSFITVFTPSFADESNTNAQNLTVKEVVARLDASRYRVIMFSSSTPDPRIVGRQHTTILPWRKHGNTLRVLARLVVDAPDVYFFPREGPIDGAFFSARAKLRLRSALVTYVVSGGLDAGQEKDRPLLWRAMRESDALAANSRHMAETVRKLSGKNVHVVYDGIDRRYYYAGMQPAAASCGRRVLFAGSFRAYKRADLVVQQATRFPEWEFRLAGMGEEENSCRELARSLIAQNVKFVGHLNAEQLGEEMRQAQIFFFPSALEGHPQVLGQAAACGLPCIARSSYEPDYVVNGVTGLLGKSDEELSAALARLIDDSELRRQMSAAAIGHAEEFEWDDVTRRWAAIMEEAIVERQNQRRKRSA